MPSSNSPDVMEERKDWAAAIDATVRRVEVLPDESARSAATELARAIMSLHENALRRMLAIIARDGPDPVMELAGDDLVSGVLALHGLHPEALELRIGRAMETLRRHFDSRGGRIQLVEFGPELIRVQLSGKHPSEADRLFVLDAFGEITPEIETVVVEGIEGRDTAFVPVSQIASAQRL